MTSNLPIRPVASSNATSSEPVPSKRVSFPIACLTLPESKLADRYRNAKAIESTVQRYDPEFRLRVEHLATILLIPFKSLQPNGGFSHETYVGHTLKDRLESVSPFCKHYMLHLDPENLRKDYWSHALPKPVQPQRPLAPDMTPREITLSMHYRAAFKTQTTSDVISTNVGDGEEVKCRSRDSNKCVLSKSDSPCIFWFIPRGFNDTVDNNNATGNLEDGCWHLARVDLTTDHLHSPRQLGKTHRVWNMICVDKRYYDYLKKGLCAFKFDGCKPLQDGRVQVRLRFFWMPEMLGRFNQIMDLDTIKRFDPHTPPNETTTFNQTKVEQDKELSVDLNIFENRGCPPPRKVNNCQAQSGKSIYINMSKQDATLFERVVKVHWACVTFTALCGGAGRAWYLTGNNPADGSLQPRDKEFRQKIEEDNKKNGEKEEKGANGKGKGQ